MAVMPNGVNGKKKILEKQQLEKDGMKIINKKMTIGNANLKNTTLTSASNQN
jgi:hypothetical protein